MAKDQADKFRAVAGHFEHESRELEDDEQHQFGAIFEEFKGVLADFVEQAAGDARLADLSHFTYSLLDSVLAYIDKKKDLERVSRLEADDYFKKLAKTHKGLVDLATSLVREAEELKPALEARLAKALEFTSMMEKDEGSPQVSGFNYPSKPSGTLQGLVNLKKTLNSPRESQARDRSRGDETTRSGKSREHHSDNMELQFAVEHLRHQVVVLQSEVDRKDSR